MGYVTTWKPRCSPTNQEGFVFCCFVWPFFIISSTEPNNAHSPWKLQQVLNWAYTHVSLPLTMVMHHTHDQKQWLKLCDRVNFQAKFPAERGTERCEEKAPVERKDTWMWQPGACGRTGLNVGVVQKHERILLQTRANIYSGLSWDIWQQFGLCLQTQISDSANKECCGALEPRAFLVWAS